MKIKLKAQYVGPRGVFAPGEVLDLPEAEASALVSGGYASAVVEKIAKSAPADVEASPEVETADLKMESMEKAIRPRAKKK